MRRTLTGILILPLALAAGCAQTESVAGQASRNASGRMSVNTNVSAGTHAGFTDADYARHVEQLKKKLPSREFEIVVEKPFVVVGDGGRAAVEEDARGTVRWAVTLLKKDYFTKDPKEILNIWLFKDSVSYNKHATDLFGSKPSTPYGYYSSVHKSLVMNIETGGGTLVHEIVHPFVEANFPDCPPWLNEGLGSLYEQSGEQDGHIVGYTNWRLPVIRLDELTGVEA